MKYGVITVVEIRKELMPGVYLTALQTDKFKTGLISVSLLTRLTREDAAPNALIPHVLRRGTRRYGDMDALAARLDSLYGARIEPVVRKLGEIQAVGFWADFADERFLPEGGGLLEEVTQLLGEVLLCPNTRGGLLLPAYVESEKQKLLEDMRARVNDKIAYSRMRMIELMCAAEDYGADALGTEESAEGIRYIELTKRYKKLLAESPVEVFYCGSADADRVEAAVCEALMTLPRGELDPDLGTDIRMNTVEETARTVTETADVAQGKLVIGFRLGECMEEPDIPALRVMNAVFGAGVSSKLFMNVRERLSLCYYAASSVDLIKGLMLVFSGIEPENRDAAVSEIFRQWEAMRAGDITEEELAAAKLSLMSELRGASDGAGELEGFWLYNNLLGLEWSPDELAALVEDVTREQVAAAAQTAACDMIYFLTGEEDEDDAD